MFSVSNREEGTCLRGELQQQVRDGSDLAEGDSPPIAQSSETRARGSCM